MAQPPTLTAAALAQMPRATVTTTTGGIEKRYEGLGFCSGQDVYAQVKAVSLIAAGRSFCLAGRAASADSREGEAAAKLTREGNLWIEALTERLD